MTPPSISLNDQNIATVDGDWISQEIFQRGLTCDPMIRELLPHINQGDWVIDGGAAMGDHTAAYLSKVGDRGQVFAFEPNPWYFHCLQHNCPAAIHIKRPLWSEPLDFYLHSPVGNQGGGFINTISTAESDGDLVSGPYPAVVIDHLGLDRLNYVKLDLEGAEYYALLGMKNTIARCKPKICIEMNPGPASRFGLTHMSIYDLLDSYGYDYKSIRNEPHRHCKSCDILAWAK